MTASMDGRAAAIDRLTRSIRWIAFVAFVLLALYVLADVFLIVFAAVLIAAVLRGAGNRVSAWTGLSKGWSLFLVVVTLVAVIAAVVWLQGPRFLHEAEDLWGQLIDRLDALWGTMQDVQWAQDLVARVREYLSGGGSMAGQVAGAATSTLGILGTLVVVVATALYLAAAPRLYISGTLRLLPPPWRPRGRDVLLRLGDVLRWWFVGQLVDMVVVAMLSWIGLMILGVPLAATLALIAGLFNFVPYVGALAGAAPAVVVAFSQGTDQALWVAALFFVVQAIEGNIVAPLVQRRTVDLPPVVTILSQTVLGTLFGPLGLILATPLAAAGVTAVRLVYVESVLEDSSTGREGADSSG